MAERSYFRNVGVSHQSLSNTFPCLKPCNDVYSIVNIGVVLAKEKLSLGLWWFSTPSSVSRALCMCVCAHACVCGRACVFACTYACVYAGKFVCMYVCMYIYLNVCLFVCIFVSMDVCMHACMYVHMHIIIYIYMYTHTNALAQIHTHTCTHTHTHTHTHAHAYAHKNKHSLARYHSNEQQNKSNRSHAFLLHWVPRIPVWCLKYILVCPDRVPQMRTMIIGWFVERNRTDRTSYGRLCHWVESAALMQYIFSQLHKQDYIWEMQCVFLVPCLAWLVYMSNLTHFYEWHNTAVRLTWLLRMCDMTHSYVWHGAIYE